MRIYAPNYYDHDSPAHDFTREGGIQPYLEDHDEAYNPADDDPTVSPCPCCAHYNHALGDLGRLLHYVCQCCGIWYHEQNPYSRAS